jgi:glycosyltransferase involved in cell wall biosynthesis
MVARSLLIVTPVFNDWDSFGQLLAEIDRIMPAWNVSVDVIAVDDGSSLRPGIEASVNSLQNINSVSVVSLAANMGHQRAIAVGLAHANRMAAHDLCLVMDSDGEDRPEDIATMLSVSAKKPGAVVVAKRAQRSESWRFRAFYKVYKTLFRLLTGKAIDFGNFCLIPGDQLGRIAHMAELWNHFAGALVRSRIPLESTDTTRGTRYAGQSTMNFVSLVVHGLSAISVFSDLMFVRLLVGSLIVGALPVLISVVAIALRFTTDLAIPGWTTNIAGFAALAILQILTLLVTSVLVSLSGRSGFPFVPAIHALTYIKETTCLRRSRKDPVITAMKATN